MQHTGLKFEKVFLQKIITLARQFDRHPLDKAQSLIDLIAAGKCSSGIITGENWLIKKKTQPLFASHTIKQ